MVVPGRRVNSKALRMDLVDGHVHVLVVFVVVAGCDVLVFGKPKDVDKIFHNVPELVPVQAAVLWVKRDD